MLTDEDILRIAMLLEEYGLEKKPSAGAVRTRRYRERKASQNVTHQRHKTSQGKGQAVTKASPPTVTTWAAYSQAYQAIYHVEPRRNAMVNGLLAQFVARLGAEESPLVAAFYLGHQGRYYVQEMHSVPAMVRNAEKLRTEWATQRVMTETEARQSDKTAAIGNAFGELIEEARNARH